MAGRIDYPFFRRTRLYGRKPRLISNIKPGAVGIADKIRITSRIVGDKIHFVLGSSDSNQVTLVGDANAGRYLYRNLSASIEIDNDVLAGRYLYGDLSSTIELDGNATAGRYLFRNLSSTIEFDSDATAGRYLYRSLANAIECDFDGTGSALRQRVSTGSIVFDGSSLGNVIGSVTASATFNISFDSFTHGLRIEPITFSGSIVLDNLSTTEVDGYVLDREISLAGFIHSYKYHRRKRAMGRRRYKPILTRGTYTINGPGIAANPVYNRPVLGRSEFNEVVLDQGVLSGELAANTVVIIFS